MLIYVIARLDFVGDEKLFCTDGILNKPSVQTTYFCMQHWLFVHCKIAYFAKITTLPMF